MTECMVRMCSCHSKAYFFSMQIPWMAMLSWAGAGYCRVRAQGVELYLPMHVITCRTPCHSAWAQDSNPHPLPNHLEERWSHQAQARAIDPPRLLGSFTSHTSKHDIGCIGGVLARRASFFDHSPPVPVFAPTSPNNVQSTFSPCLRIRPIICTQFMTMARVMVGSGGSDILCC